LFAGSCLTEQLVHGQGDENDEHCEAGFRVDGRNVFGYVGVLDEERCLVQGRIGGFWCIDGSSSSNSNMCLKCTAVPAIMGNGDNCGFIFAALNNNHMLKEKLRGFIVEQWERGV